MASTIMSKLYIDLELVILVRLSHFAVGCAGRIVHYMDIESPNKEVSKDLAVESLIAISNLLPDNVVENGVPLTKSSNTGNGAAVKNSDVAEKYRSELISISYQSPDAKALPVAVNREG